MINSQKLFNKINPSRLARLLNVIKSTVYMWKYSKSIPSWRVPAIEKCCAEHDIDISDCYEETGK